MNVYKVSFDVSNLTWTGKPIHAENDSRETLWVRALYPEDAIFYAGMMWVEQYMQGCEIKFDTLQNISVTFVRELSEEEL